jgi:hypothetical protein
MLWNNEFDVRDDVVNYSVFQNLYSDAVKRAGRQERDGGLDNAETPHSATGNVFRFSFCDDKIPGSPDEPAEHSCAL